MNVVKIVGIVALILVIVGGINWGLVGAFDFNLVGFLFAKVPVVARIVYILVGLSALYIAYDSYKKGF